MARRNPFDEIEEVFERMNRELEQLGDQLGGEFRPDVKVDVIEYDEELVVVADLPGFDADEIDLSLAGRELTISAEREAETETGAASDDGEVHRRERRRQSVERRVRLPVEVADGETSASYENGVLTVRLPTLTTEEGTEIEVN